MQHIALFFRKVKHVQNRMRSYFLPAASAILNSIILLHLNLLPNADGRITIRWMVVFAINPTHAAWRVATLHIVAERSLLGIGG
jgi:hypothetical protein